MIVLLGFSSINKFGVIVIFKLNQEYIVKNLCENRFKKNSTCNGKCYLSKELKKHDHEKGDSRSTFQFMDEYVDSFLILNISFKPIFIPITWNEYYKQDSLSEFSNSIFQPPAYHFFS